jgi:hypothetical protein
VYGITIFEVLLIFRVIKLCGFYVMPFFNVLVFYYGYTFLIYRIMIIFNYRPGLKRPAAQPEDFRGRGRGFTPVRYICNIVVVPIYRAKLMYCNVM